MASATLNNITIKEKKTKSYKPYYLIVDEDKKQAYFCFSGANGWKELVKNKERLKKIYIKFKENFKRDGIYKQIVSLKNEARKDSDEDNKDY